MTATATKERDFEYDPRAHIYRVDGRVRESVTQALAGLKIIDPARYPQAARDRGTAVHKATVHLESKRGLDWASLEPIERLLGEAIVPRVRAWETFLKRTGWHSRLVEEPNYHPTYLYCGTADRIGRFPGDAAETIIDLKSGGPEAWHELQSGAYEEMERAHDGQRRHRIAVELREDGTYRIHKHDRHEDAQEFIDLLAAYRIGRRKGYFQPIPHAEELDL